MLKSLLPVAIALSLGISCVVTQFGTPSNTYFVNTQATGWAASGPSSAALSTGEACAMAWGFYIQFAYGDASIENAARKVGINKIHSAS